MTTTLHADLVLDARADLGEGPAWDTRDGCLLWVDIPRGRLHRFHPDSGVDEVHELGTMPGAVAPHADGGYVLAIERGFAQLRDDDMVLLADLARPGLRMNDGTCAPDGAFWAGTMAVAKTPGAGTLYRLAPDGTVEIKLTEVTISNGLAFTPDGARLYYIDTPTLRVDLFDVTPGQDLLRRRPFVEFPAGHGRPDGLTLDNDGCVWVALFREGAVHRYTPDGVLDLVVELPIRYPTSCAFGGPCGDTLFITSAQAPPDARGSRLDGGLFAIRPGVSGPAAFAYQRRGGLAL